MRDSGSVKLYCAFCAAAHSWRPSLAPGIVKPYNRIIQEFASHFHQPHDRLGRQHLRQYQACRFQEKKLNGGTVQLHVAALRLF
jgi:hypothetical protein